MGEMSKLVKYPFVGLLFGAFLILLWEFLSEPTFLSPFQVRLMAGMIIGVIAGMILAITCQRKRVSITQNRPLLKTGFISFSIGMFVYLFYFILSKRGQGVSLDLGYLFAWLISLDIFIVIPLSILLIIIGFFIKRK